MTSNDAKINFKSVQSCFNIPFLCCAGLILGLWILGVVWVLVSIFSTILKSTPITDQFSSWIYFLAGSIICLLSLFYITIKKESFYTHLIINEEGLIFFDFYKFKPSKIIRWNQICSQPQKNQKYDRDVYIKFFFSGYSQVFFWQNIGEPILCKETFGGYGPIPFTFKNKKELRNAFVLGLLLFRKDLLIDPKLIRYAAIPINEEAQQYRDRF